MQGIRMTKEIQIRGVTVELLRAGPPHNQLLSPLTQYLGICGDSQAGIVNLGYEHKDFMRQLKSMRYESGEDSERLPVLSEMGVEMAKILGAIPRLTGALTSDSEGPDTLIHLRLVLSASELAALPFELAKIPVGPTTWAEGWLALQTRPPVVITRRTRNVSPEGVRWPTRPRILFIASDPAEIPFEEHRTELLTALQPFQYPGRDDPVLSSEGRREQFGDLLTILKNATFDDIVTECGRVRYTHVHVLAHGDVDPATEGTSYGLVLHTADGDPDIVSGERFASAFAGIVDGVIHRPTVVTLASCDSGDVKSVIVPGASFAHVLHQAGIPLVIASQFPLGKQSSILLVRTLYQGLMWGMNPWILLHQIRTGLHGRFTAHSHDWASLVVYEALPVDLADQLEEARYCQARLAIEAALERIDQAVAGGGARVDHKHHQELVQTVNRNCDKLPMNGRFAMECLGLRASSNKRLAQAEFNLAMAYDADSREHAEHLRQSCSYLEQSLLDYQQSVAGFLVNQGRPVQRIASLHWVLVQLLCLSAVLGKATRAGAWETARLSAEAYLDWPDANEQAWAHASLAELWLLKLTDAALNAEDRAQAARLATQHVTELVKILGRNDGFAIQSTRKQFARYLDWWGLPRFEQGIAELGLVERSSWNIENLNVIKTARDIIDILDRRSAVQRAAPSTKAAPQPAAALPPVTPRRSRTALISVATSSPTAATERLTGVNSADAFFDIEMLPAGHGDCLWMQYGAGKTTARLLIDCGTVATYNWLQKRVAQQAANARDFELFILSHIDADHIGGAIPFFADKTLGVSFAEVWFNGYRQISSTLGAKQGEIFSTLIQQNQLPWNRWRDGGTIVLEGRELPTYTLPGGMRLTLLSPSKDKLATLAPKWEKEIKALNLTPGKAEDFEKFLGKTPSKSTDVDKLADANFNSDTAAPNGSSIAVLAEYKGKSALLAADAHAPLMVSSIKKLLKQRGAKKLKVDAFKVAHHASQNNLNIELLQLLDCKNYLISTNGSHFNHPDREAIGRIIKYGGDKPRLYFNYMTKLNDVWASAELQEKYDYQAVFPEPGKEGLIIRL
jgi:beta-lactamase superfamily II metal-dependent hydrolase